jgi:hypothetical protein
MANILLRSPYYEYNTQAGSSTATMELYTGGTLRYTLSKDVDADEGALFDISELARDYLDITFDGTYTSQVVAITGNIKFYDSSNVQVGSTVNFSHKGFDGYGRFLDGANPTITSGSLLQSNTKIYWLEGQAGRIPEESGGAINYYSFGSIDTSASVGGQTVSIERICEPRYTPILVNFVNKFGAIQGIYFFKKSIESVSTSSETYKRSLVDSTGSYSINEHSVRTLRTVGTESITMNTGYMDQGMNRTMEELLMSHQVWATINSVVTPIIITSNQLTYKTSVNDRLVDYTITADMAFNLANDLR